MKAQRLPVPATQLTCGHCSSYVPAHVRQSTAACFFISALVKSVGLANFIASLYFIFSMLFGGLFVSSRSGSLSGLRYASFAHYGWEALMTNEFEALFVVFNPKNVRSVLVYVSCGEHCYFPPVLGT